MSEQPATERTGAAPAATLRPRDVVRLCEAIMVLSSAMQEGLPEPKWWWSRRRREDRECRRRELSEPWGIARDLHNRFTPS